MITVLDGQTPVLPGKPYPLGPTWDGRGVNFALFSANAEAVELCLFSANGKRETTRIKIPNRTNQVWHCYLPEARPGLLYGYRVYGPYAPEQGHRFNHHKLLIDPYARLLKGDLKWTGAHNGYKQGHARTDLSFDRRDSARVTPKCVVVDSAFSWGDDRRPEVPWTDTVIYETHVRGFTMRHEGIPKGERGLFAGLGHRDVIKYLKALGITSVELLPIHAFVDDAFLVEKGLRNYWGYSTLSYFAPEPRYLGAHNHNTLKTMIMRLHDAGIEVLLDVVYNHTAEGNQLGPTLSFRGIDNLSYYRLHPENKRYYLNDTGCGNTLDLSHPRVVQLVTDSLRYWVEDMHVDGFRFDLASVLGRESTGFDRGSGFFDALMQDPVLSQVKLIAEPWDIGPGGYRLGQFPWGWAEWNDQTRDTVRTFWLGDQNILPHMARRLHGSSDRFEHDKRHPWASINYVTSHDGFTLNDLVSYNQRHNLANGEENRDGHKGSRSNNHGVEGPSTDPAVMEIRRRQQRNMLATVILSQGTPMLLAGDELCRTQAGNNNAYCQDNETSWMNWPDFSEADYEHAEFVKRLLKLRRDHPVLRRPYYLHGRYQSPRTGFQDISWVNPGGSLMDDSCWHVENARCLGLLLAGDALPEGIQACLPPEDDTLLMIFNANHESVPFTLPAGQSANGWTCLLDSARPKRPSHAIVVPFGRAFIMAAQSVAVFALIPEEQAGLTPPRPNLTAVPKKPRRSAKKRAKPKKPSGK